MRDLRPKELIELMVQLGYTADPDNITEQQLFKSLTHDFLNQKLSHRNLLVFFSHLENLTMTWMLNQSEDNKALYTVDLTVSLTQFGPYKTNRANFLSKKKANAL